MDKQKLACCHLPVPKINHRRSIEYKLQLYVWLKIEIT